MKRGMIFVFIFLFVIIISSIVIVLVYDTDKEEIIFEEVQNESVIEISFVSQTQEYDNSQKIMDLINSFEIIERDETLVSAKNVYIAGKGTEYDLLRLSLNILLNHQIQGVLLVYEYGENVGAAVNFRDVKQPMYYYFENGVLKMKHHGWSFEELIVAEENRLGIKIDKYGILFEGDLRSDKILNIKDVEMWKER